MRNFFIPALLVMAFASCGNEAVNPGLNMNNLDKTVRPQDDFYQFACGGWMASNPLTPEFARYGTFDKLRDNNQAQVKGLIEKLSSVQTENGSVQQKIGDLYKMGMDEKTLNSQGNTPIQNELKSISEINDRKKINTKIKELQTYQVSSFFVFFSEADLGNSEMCIPWIYQGGMGLGQKEYYLDDDKRSVEIREKYLAHVKKMFELSGYDKLSGKNVDELTEQAYNIEIRLAKAAMNKLDLRDMSKIYNKTTVAELQKSQPQLEWSEFMSYNGLQNVNDINVAQPLFLKEVSEIVKSGDIEQIKSYLAWCYIHFAAPYLSDDFVAENFNFYGKVLSGKEEQRPRWKIIVDVVNDALGEAVGQAYVAEYFPAESKAKMLDLVKNLQIALGERIDALDWMSDETKAQSREKLASFRVKIGYPDKWRDYSTLEIKNDSYLNNILRANKFDHQYYMSQAGKPTDKDKWGMYPQTVNAYYNPTTNEIAFPAGILQPPFFNPKADDAVNYGGIGVVIAHEMTHGFDDQGSKFDKDGNMRNWWTASDKEKFDARTEVLANWFDKIEVLPGMQANGKFTLGENIADNGGVQISFQGFTNSIKGKTLKDIDGLTPQQRFFISYATLWAENVRDAEVERLTKIDVHSLGKWRTNATVPHIAAFAEAFDVKPGDKMYLEPEKRASIW